MLCAICQKIFTGLFWDNSGPHSLPGDHHITSGSLRNSARENCFICDQLWLALLECRSENQGNLDMLDVDDLIIECAITPFSSYTFISSSTDPTIELQIDLKGHFILPEVLPTFILSPRNILARELSGSPVGTSNTNSPATLQLARTWISDCLQNHQSCKILSEPPWRPTRLLEIDYPVAGQISLRVTSDPTVDCFSGSYVALSHCWGCGESFRLTSDTHAMLRDGLRISTIARTFQDAISIARSLRIKFVWIDSLCIIQGSRKDWENEAPLMDKVYSNALCTIAATSSSSSEEGCFRERNATLLQPTAVMSSWDDHTNHDYHIYDKHTIKTHFRRSPLLKRGWVLQEYYQSRRFLHFGARQVFWECRQLHASEVYPLGLPRWMIRSELSLKSFEEVLARPIAEDIYGLWSKVVNHYSGCKLTKERDKLVAISAIAKSLHLLLDDVYLAGLWEKQLPNQLLWCNVDESSKISPPEHYQAPSWSWASINSAVEMPDYPATQYPGHLGVEPMWSKVLEAHTESRDGGATGEVLSGFIRLRGPLATVVFEQGKWNGSIRDGLYILGRWIELDGRSGREWSRIIADCGACVDTEGEIYKRNLHFMPVRQFTSAESVEVHGLLLEPVGDARGHFRRFGVLKLGPDKSFSLEALRDAQKHVWFEYEESHEMGEYTVTII